MVQEVNSKFWVTYPRIAQFVYFSREMCLVFNFWMVKFTIMFFFYIHAWNFSTKVLYTSKNTLSSKMTQFCSVCIFFEGSVCFWHVHDLSWEISCLNVKKKHNYEIIIQKLKNSLKKYTNWAILGHGTQNLEFSSWTTSFGPKLHVNLPSKPKGGKLSNPLWHKVII